MKRNIVLFSPVIIIGINHVVARVAGQIMGAWVFIPVVLIAWAMTVFIIFL